jgi:hypothetical protein
MTATMVLVAVAVVLALSAPAPASGTVANVQSVPYLSMADGKRVLNRWLVRKVNQQEQRLPIAIDDWQISRCFRWARNAIQCRWWMVGYDYERDWNFQCYGNARTILRGGYTYTRAFSSRCVSA